LRDSLSEGSWLAHFTPHRGGDNHWALALDSDFPLSDRAVEQKTRLEWVFLLHQILFIDQR
jgi:hypothetical protein